MHLLYQQLGSRRLCYTTERVERISEDIVAQGAVLVNEWPRHFEREADTWVEREAGVPSLIVRLDCTIVDGTLTLYEVEERPAGIGMATLMNPQFVDRFTALRRSWPDIAVFVSPRREELDEPLWATVVHVNPRNGSRLLVRADPDEEAYHELAPMSISTVRNKGKKQYGLAMGLWRTVYRSDDLPWDRSFVIKPIQGSKMHDVFIYYPKENISGRHTRTAITRYMEGLRGCPVYCQEFAMPMETGVATHCFMMYRIFYGFNPTTRVWMCLGGLFTARSNLRIHGAEDACFGALQIA